MFGIVVVNAVYVLLYSLFLITAVLDLHCTKNLKNAATTTLTEVINAVKKSVEECKVVAMRAEDNYIAWYSCDLFILLILR
jgi:uncharacterized protein (DUF2141 family)